MKIRGAFLGNTHSCLQSNSYPSTALLCCSFSGVLDQHASHRIGSDGIEVDPIFGMQVLLIGQPEVGFVNQRGRLQSALTIFSSKPDPGHAEQVTVNQRSQLFQDRMIPLTPADEERRLRPPDLQGPL